MDGDFDFTWRQVYAIEVNAAGEKRLTDASDTWYGLWPFQVAEFVQYALDTLKDVAAGNPPRKQRHRLTAEGNITYEELCNRVAYDTQVGVLKEQWVVAKLLGLVAAISHARYGVLLTTFVVQEQTDRPANGYYSAVEMLTRKPVADREACWQQQAAACRARFAERPHAA
jgi:hypothetical protein